MTSVVSVVEYDGCVRYHRQKRGLFYFMLSVSVFTGLAMLLTPHRTDTFIRFAVFILLANIPLQCLFYFLSYFETLPESLESRHLWRRKYVSYSEISCISPHKSWYGVVTVNLRYSRVRNLPVFVDRPADFLADIVAHAPHAHFG